MRALREGLVVWLVTRVLLLATGMAVTYYGAGVAGQGDAPGWFADRMIWWDAKFYLGIARDGYFPGGDVRCYADHCAQVFFPGYPITVRLVAAVLGSFPWAALLVSNLAGAGACVLLHRVAAVRAEEVGRDPVTAGRVAVLLLCLHPYGIYLSAAYSESLFLLFSLAAWHAGQRGRPGLAGVWAAAAAVTRINGLLVALAAVALCLRGRRTDRPATVALVVGPPLLAVAAFATYLHASTGRWAEWSEAQSEGWGRRTDMPFTGAQDAWDALRTGLADPVTVVTRSADLGFLVIGILAMLLLIDREWWVEGTHLGGNLILLVVSNSIISTPRYSLAWVGCYLFAAASMSPRRSRGSGVERRDRVTVAESGAANPGAAVALGGLGLALALSWASAVTCAVMLGRWAA